MPKKDLPQDSWRLKSAQEHAHENLKSIGIQAEPSDTKASATQETQTQPVQLAHAQTQTALPLPSGKGEPALL